MKPPTTFDTARLHLRPPAIDDAPILFALYAHDPAVTKYLVWRPHPDVEATQVFIQNCLDRWQQCESNFPWIIERRQDSQILGMIEMRIDRQMMEVGYVLARRFWGQGFMSEAVRVAVDWAIAQPEIYRVWAVCDVDNLASARVMEKVGMQREGLLRRWIMHPNISSEPRDCWCYARVK